MLYRLVSSVVVILVVMGALLIAYHWFTNDSSQPVKTALNMTWEDARVTVACRHFDTIWNFILRDKRRQPAITYRMKYDPKWSEYVCRQFDDSIQLYSRLPGISGRTPLFRNTYDNSDHDP